MRVVDESTLDLFRGLRTCEWCKKVVMCDCHHWYAKGMGGGSRLDIVVNLASLCRPCHDMVHAGIIHRFDLLEVIAQRENLLQDEIEREIYRVLRAPKCGA